MADESHAETREDIVGEIERRRVELTQRLLSIYDLYRVFVGLTLILVASQTAFVSQVGSLNPTAFWWVAIGYSSTNAVILLVARASRWRPHAEYVSALVVADLLCLVYLMHLSGGVASGLAALVLIAVAAGAILVEGRRATFIAAIASIAVLFEEFYLGLRMPAQYDLFQAGVYGAMYFATSLVIQRLSRRARENELHTLTQEAELVDLERLNRLIIQRMRTGILVVDQNNHVRMSNQSARVLLGSEANMPFVALPEILIEKLDEWRSDMSMRTPPFKASIHTSEIRVNFSAVRADTPGGDVTIFIEDTAEVAQQAQQLKLAELGRLSASIAHEVRNPLGAISHAAQLMNESEELAPADQRLTDIIVKHCQRMNDVVANVLEMSRRSPPTPRKTSLHEVVEQFLEASRGAFVGAQIDSQMAEVDTSIRIDAAHILQALTNLVDNALRYSEANGAGRRALLEGGLEPSSDRPYLNVIDFGPGVESDQVPKLFQPFNTTALGGTGLGLYIAKELCDANQAQLSYFPHSEGGSCFRILFAHPDRITV